MNFIDAFISMAPLLITILMLLFIWTFIMDIIIHYSEKNGHIPIAVHKGLNDRGILELEADMEDGTMPLWDYLVVDEEGNEEVVLRLSEIRGSSDIVSISKKFILDFGEYSIVDQFTRNTVAYLTIDEDNPNIKIKLTQAEPSKGERLMLDYKELKEEGIDPWSIETAYQRPTKDLDREARYRKLTQVRKNIFEAYYNNKTPQLPDNVRGIVDKVRENTDKSSLDLIENWMLNKRTSDLSYGTERYIDSILLKEYLDDEENLFKVYGYLLSKELAEAAE